MKMQNSKSFNSEKKFLGLDLYPYGLSRSGDFTRKQAALLEQHGEAYKELQTGIRKPVTREEKEFVAACRGEKEPETEHELVWFKYNLRSRKKFVTAFAGSYEKSEDDHDDEHGFINDELELDED